ncbi:MAG: hypothetical protein ACXVCP_12240 [Bdellovibrio sp.]
MKRLMFFIFAIFVVACQGNNGGNNNNIAVTPLNLNCINGTAYCNNNMYTQYQGYAPYPGLYGYPYNYTNYFNQYGFCNCPSGYIATYNGSYGLGCVNTQLLQPYYGYYSYYQFGYGVSSYPAPQTTINYGQYSNIPGASNSGSCSGSLTQSCLLNQMYSCGTGAMCQPVVAGSNLGICVRYY